MNRGRTKQQPQDETHDNEPRDTSKGPDKPRAKLDDVGIEDTPIQKLWDVAYEKLREEDGTLIAEYEARLIGSIAAGLSQTLSLKANRRELLQVILQSKMDEAKLIASIGSQTKDALQLVLNVTISANDYISNVANSNPYTSIAWTGIIFFSPLFTNLSGEEKSLAKGLGYIASLIELSRMREELYIQCYEPGTSNGEKFRQPHIQYKTALKRLYRQILKFQAITSRHYSKKLALCYGLDAVKWNDWAPLVDKVRE